MKQAKYPSYALLLLFPIAILALVIEKSLPKQKAVELSEVTIVKPVEIIDTVIMNVEGRRLYEANCATCHGRYGRIDGPSVIDAEIRGPWTGRHNLIRWIKNPEAMMNEFEYTRQLVAQFNGQLMPSFPQLSDRDIEAIHS